ncbi:MAG: pyruvate dehydrogenase complex dihydrolipoamide acetyltransferase [Hyphomicrobiales bacterium]|nr:pyruvate dehydrogenase complex dihydrolipoamide acetyltransferase [Hyphomicrobiales bacterium]
MPTPILMPALSPTMEEGKLAKWLVKEGDTVKPGKVIAEIETDKATMEVEAIDDGVIGQILVAAGTEGVKVNTPIAMLLAEGEKAGAATRAAPAPSAAPAPAAARPAAAASAVTAAAAAAATRAATGPAAPAVAAAPMMTAAAAAQPASGERVFASPLARRLAKAASLDLRLIQGSGPHGRIVQRDVEKARTTGVSALKPVAGTAVAVPAAGAVGFSAMPDDKILALYEKGSYDVLPHDGMRRVIAQRLTQSKQTVPHFYLSLDCRLDELLRARERINAASPKEGPKAYKLSVNDFIIKALALALQRVPAANATWTEQGMLRHRHSDVGVAVAIEGGLFTPVIRHAELKTLGEISNEMKDLAERARKRRLAPHEYQGGTTSISNLGMFGIKSFDAVINPPHATILAVGAGEKRAVVIGDKLEVATIMSCTLSCDHRVVDGALGAELLNAFKQLIEDPVRMLV